MNFFAESPKQKPHNDLTFRIVEKGSVGNPKSPESWVSMRLNFYQKVNGKEVLVGYVSFRMYPNGPFDLYYVSNLTVLPEFRHRKQAGQKDGVVNVGIRLLENVKYYIMLQNKILKRKQRSAIVTLNDGTKKDDNPPGVWGFYNRHDFVQVPDAPSHFIYYPERRFSVADYIFLRKRLNLY